MVPSPETPCPLRLKEFSLLKTLIDPLALCDDFGVVMCVVAREFVRDHKNPCH